MGLGENAVAYVVDGSLAGALQAVLGVNALNTVGGIDVLDHGELPTGSASLAGDDGRVGQEVLPNLRNGKSSSQPCSMCIMNSSNGLTLNHLLPYLASTFSRLPIQLRYQRQRVAE